MTDKIYDSIIIGAGPAGVTASIYLIRYGLDILLFEAKAIGGQLLSTFNIENYPGYSSITGANLAVKLYEQIDFLKIPIKYEIVVDILKLEDGKIKIITNLSSYLTKTTILATGLKPRKLIKTVKNYEKFDYKGISYCAICDGFFYKEKVIAIIGGGNSAVEEALALTKIVKKIYLINRDKNLICDNILEAKLKKEKKIEIINETELIEINGTNKIDSIIIKNNNNNSIKTLFVEGIFVFIGFIADLSNLKNLALEYSNNYLKVNKNFETNLLGIYAIGDLVDKSTKQIVTAMSDGIIAASSIKKTFL